MLSICCTVGGGCVGSGGWGREGQSADREGDEEHPPTHLRHGAVRQVHIPSVQGYGCPVTLHYKPPSIYT